MIVSNWLFSLIALTVIALSIVAGFRKGFKKQLPRLFGALFGIICARIFMQPMAQLIAESFPMVNGRTETNFILTVIGAGLVYIVAYTIFSFATFFLPYIFRSKERGVLDSIAGALLSLFVYLMFLSLAYNFLVCINPATTLMKSMRSDDGNIIEEVLLTAPTILGSETPEELAHKQQLDEARKIS